MQQGKLDKLAEAFHVLGHPTKLTVLDLILEERASSDSPLVPTLVATQLNMTVARVSYSLKRMHEAGILKRQCSGRYTFYTIDDAFLKLIKEFF